MFNKGSHSIGHLNNVKDERYVLVFDFETTGLPKDNWADFEPYPTIKKGKESNPEDWPHAVQFSYVLYDTHENTAKIVNEVIRLPDGVSISPGSEAIHKISIEKSRAAKYEIGDLLPTFMEDFRKADVIVAHNIRFDRNVMLAELSRLHEQVFQDFMREFYNNKKEYCTGNYGADECKMEATNKAGRKYYKMPKLNVLYEKMFQNSPAEDKLHDAFVDVVVCLRCFYKMRYKMDLYQDPHVDPIIVKCINYISPEK